MKVIYRITVSAPEKCNPELHGACFESFGLSADTLRMNNFEYSYEAELWHNGSSEAWISRVPLRKKVMLGKEEVQLR